MGLITILLNGPMAFARYFLEALLYLCHICNNPDLEKKEKGYIA
jgi:hypothetical protein